MSNTEPSTAPEIPDGLPVVELPDSAPTVELPTDTAPPVLEDPAPAAPVPVQVTPAPAPAAIPAPIGIGAPIPAPISVTMPVTVTPAKTSAALTTNTPSHQFLVLMEGAAISALGGGATGILAGISGLTGDKVMSSDAWLAFAAAVGVSALHTLAAWIVTKTTNR